MIVSVRYGSFDKGVLFQYNMFIHLLSRNVSTLTNRWWFLFSKRLLQNVLDLNYTVSFNIDR